MPSFGLPGARAEASRRNGAKSCGPKTPEGKARSAQNALRHGLRAQKHVVLPGESATEFAALEAALMEELAPEGALQSVLAQRVVAAAWRPERIEAGLFGHHLRGERNLGLALIRDGNGPRAFDTLLRYRGTTLAELWRALRTLKALQAEEAAQPEPALGREPRLLPEPHETPIKPESRANLNDSPPPQAAIEPVPPRAATVPAAMPCERAARTELPDKPESRGNPSDFARPGDRAAPRRGDPSPAEPARPPLPIEIAERAAASLLAGTALVPLGRRR
jgi:hypothetical protein